MATRPQLAIARMAATTFVAGFFLIYPGGFLSYNFSRPVKALPQATVEGLKDRYGVGKELAFSVRVEGTGTTTAAFLKLL